MVVGYYSNRSEPHRYGCHGDASHYGGEPCFSITGPCLDDAVTEQVLRAIEPAAIELSLEAARSLERERCDLLNVWEQRLERATYEVSHAARQYHAVDPENRLVARELERQWEEKLFNEQSLQEKYRRFQSTQARGLTEDERQKVRRLATDIPALWGDSETQNQERKTILREVIERVVVNAQGRSERVKLQIDWVGGSTTEWEVTRPMARFEQLSYFPELCDRIRTLVASGITETEIAQELNRQGLRPINPRQLFDAQRVARLMRRLALVSKRASTSVAQRELNLADNEWTMPALAREIGMPEGTLRAWIERGLVTRRREGAGARSRWILWADEERIQTLRERRARGPGYYSHQRWVHEADVITRSQA